MALAGEHSQLAINTLKIASVHKYLQASVSIDTFLFAVIAGMKSPMFIAKFRRLKKRG